MVQGTASSRASHWVLGTNHTHNTSEFGSRHFALTSALTSTCLSSSRDTCAPTVLDRPPATVVVIVCAASIFTQKRLAYSSRARRMASSSCAALPRTCIPAEAETPLPGLSIHAGLTLLSLTLLTVLHAARKKQHSSASRAARRQFIVGASIAVQ